MVWMVHADIKRDRGLLSRRSLIVCAALICFCFLATSGAILWKLRQQTWDAAARAAQNLVAAVSQDLGRNIELYDLSLQAVIEGLQLPGIERLDISTRQALLFDRAATARYLGSILVINERGDVVEDAGAVPPRSANLADRSYFIVHRDNPNAGLYISEPFRRRVTGVGDWVIAFSRRINKPDGSFGGVVSGALRLDYFKMLFTQFSLGPQSAITLFRADGTLLARSRNQDNLLGRRFVDTPIIRKFTAATKGQFVETATLDGMTKAITFEHVSDQPLVVFVAQSLDDIFAEWTRWSVGIVVVLISMCSLIGVLALFAGWELRRRAEAEVELRKREEQLRLLSDHATDVIVRLDASLIRRYVSSSSLDVFGYSPEELVGQDFRNSIVPDDRENATDAVENARHVEGRASVSYRIRRKTGEVAWVESQFSYMRGDGGFTALVRDVTQRKMVEHDLAKAHDELRRLAATDGLTGLANRRRFDETILVEWRRAAREDRPVSVLLLDVDRFKQFNDEYGHVAGDVCLKTVAQTIAACVRRPADLAARYGGEEFVVLLPGTGAIQAADVAERIRAAVHERAILHAGNAQHGTVVTVSIGCGTAEPTASSSPDDVKVAVSALIKACDKALYQAKASGRNSVVLADKDPAILPSLSPVTSARESR